MPGRGAPGEHRRDGAVVSGLADEPPALIAFARDVASLATALDDGALATTAGDAQATVLAAAAGGRAADAGRSADDCLHSRRSAGTDYIVAEARALLTTGAPQARAVPAHARTVVVYSPAILRAADPPRRS